MGRRFLILVISATIFACGDPLIIVGDLPGFMRIVAGMQGTPGITVGATAKETLLFRPTGVITGDSGRVLYVADQRGRVLSITSSGAVRQIIGQTNCSNATCLWRAQGITLLSNNVMLIADDLAHRVWRLDLASSVLTSFAGTGTPATSPDGSPAAQSPLSRPTGVAVLPDGRVLIVEQSTNRIRVVGPDGILRTFAGTGSPGSGGDGGPAAQADLHLPSGVAVGPQHVYVSEVGTNRVREISLVTGIITTVAGTGAIGFSGDGGPARSAQLSSPTFLAVQSNNLFITDRDNLRIRTVNLTSGIITTFGGTGTSAFTGNDRAAAETALSNPAGLTISQYGFLYIADQGHHIVWRTPIRVGIF